MNSRKDILNYKKKPKNIRESEYISNIKKWYEFLHSLHRKFSNYKIQKNVEKYNVFNLDDWGKEDKRQGIKIDEKNFQVFIKKLAGFKILRYNYVKNKKITTPQLLELNKVLDITLKSTTTVDCTKNYKLIKGDYVLISKLTPYMNIECLKSKKNTRRLVVFALDTIFIDEDIFQPGFSIVLAAPRWKIIGNKTIDLNGFDGEMDKLLNYNELNNFEEPLDSDINDGKSGFPGGPGGNFIGIGKEFKNGQNLRIFSNGGEGSPGEDGKIGHDGKDGLTPFFSDSLLCTENICSSDSVLMYECEKLSCNYTEHQAWGTYYPYGKVDCDFKIFGEPGEPGNRGGHGGRGGQGGAAGKITLFELGKSSKISLYNSDGLEGKNGTGGPGGLGGFHGNNLLLHCSRDIYASNSSVTEESSDLRGPVGDIGTPGQSLFVEFPRKEPIIMKPSKFISKYKSYVRDNLKKYFWTNDLLKFHIIIENNRRIRSEYDTLGLFDELEILENQFYKTNAGEEFLPFYKSLLARIEEYADKLKKTESTEQHKIAADYLYTTTLCRIKDLEKNYESDLITNIEDHLMSVKKDVDELKNFQNAKNKADIINKYRKMYKSNIDAKIKEARNLIQKQIIPDIKEVNYQIDKNIKKLVSEVVEMQKERIDSGKKLSETKLELQKTLNIRAVLNVLEFSGQAISFLGPVGAIVGGVMDETAMLSESLIPNNVHFRSRLLQLPQSVRSEVHDGKSLIKSVTNEKIGRFEKLLNDTTVALSKDPEHYGNLTGKINGIKNTYKNFDRNALDFDRIDSLELDMKREIMSAETTTNEHIKSSLKGERSFSIEELVMKVQMAYDFGQGIFELINNFKNDEPELDAITEAIQQNQDDFYKLKQYETTIYDILTPTLHNIKNDMTKVERKIVHQSKVSLDITKWKVQKSLKKIKLQIQQMTQGFDVTENLTQCIEKLDDSMNILIDVYNYIQDYYKEQTLVNYVADISTVLVDRIRITDPTLNDAVNKLETIIRSHLILKRYQVSIDAFNQFVFPFAHFFMEKSLLPIPIKLNNNLDNLAYEVIRRVDMLLTNLKKYKDYIKNRNRIGSGEFSSRSSSVNPFFTWKNKNYKSLISKLLSGQEILVKTDIAKSEVSGDAIKFRVLSLNFKTNNETQQQKINEILKGFRINLTHLGSSFYRYDNKTYVIPSSNYNIWYSFETNQNREPISQSNEYIEIKKGNYMLSPYTVWKFSLTNLSSQRNISFENLTIFENEVDLELEGHASFVIPDKSDNINDIVLEKYYKTIKINKQNLNVKSKVKNKSKEKKIHKIYKKTERDTKAKKFDTKENKETSNNLNTWKFINFNIFPQADASSIEEINFNFNTYMHKKDIKKERQVKRYNSLSRTFLENVTTYFSKGINMLRNFSSQHFAKVKNSFNIRDSNNFLAITTNYDRNHAKKIEINGPSYINFGTPKNNVIQISKVNVNFDVGDILFAHFLLSKFLKKNITDFNCNKFISPEKEREIIINDLSEIVVTSINSYYTSHNEYKLVNNYCMQWYRNLG